MASASSTSPTDLRGLERLYSRVENMHGIVNLDAMSTLLQAMLGHLGRQEEVLTRVNEQMQETVLPTLSAFRETLDSLCSRVTAVEERVGDALRASTAQLLDAEYSAAEVATSNYYQLQKMSKAMSTLITRAEVERQYQSLLVIKDDNAAIHEDLTRVHAVLNELNLAQTQLQETLNEQESRLSLKLDRSELPRLQALASKVITYEEFKQDVSRRVQVMENQLPGFDENIAAHEREIASIKDNIETNIVFNMSKMALKKDVHVIGKELKAHHEVLQTVAFKTNIEELRASLAQTMKRIDENKRQIERTNKVILEVDKTVDTKAPQSEVELCLRKRDFEVAITNTNLELQTKTDIPFTEALQAHIQVLEQRILEESQKTAVAIKFVDWFMARGENYEHNIKIIDRHLKDLLPPENALKYSNLKFLDISDLRK